MRLGARDEEAGSVRQPVIVIGAGVAGLAAARALRDAGLDALVLERTGRAGGLIETERTPDGFVIDHGADCLLTTKPAGLEACRAVGLGDAIVTGEGSRKSFIVHDGRLLPLPSGLLAMQPGAVVGVMRSPLLSARAKARLALEPFMPRGPADDESVEAFVSRRFGRELLDRLVEPLVGGLYGGDGRVLSMEACLPQLRALERDHGSLFRASLRRSRPRPGALPWMVALRDGIGSLPDAMARDLGDALRTGVTVTSVERRAGGFAVLTDAGVLEARGVVVATPAFVAAPLLAGLSPELADDLSAVRHPPIDCVSLAWARRDVPHPFDGTGFLVATGEPMTTRACTWASEKWPGRAPAGMALVRCVMRAPDADDAELVEVARGELRDLLGVSATPVLTRVRRHARATPVFEVGHRDRAAAMASRASDLGAIALAGNAHGGVGIPDCVASGQRAAAAIVTALGDRAPTAP